LGRLGSRWAGPSALPALSNRDDGAALRLGSSGNVPALRLGSSRDVPALMLLQQPSAGHGATDRRGGGHGASGHGADERRKEPTGAGLPRSICCVIMIT
jgi:hypothetical protein